MVKRWQSTDHDLYPSVDDSTAATHTSTCSNNITIPESGFYGLYVGAKNSEAPFESVVYHDHLSQDADDGVPTGTSQNTNAANVNTTSTNNTKEQKRPKKQKANGKYGADVLHCGCTFEVSIRQPIISGSSNSKPSSSSSSSSSSSINNCTIPTYETEEKFQAPFFSNGSVTTNQHQDDTDNSYSIVGVNTTQKNDTNNNNTTSKPTSQKLYVLTSTKVGRIIHLPSSTIISVKYAYCCGWNDDDDNNHNHDNDNSNGNDVKGKHTSNFHCQHGYDWKWGLILNRTDDQDRPKKSSVAQAKQEQEGEGEGPKEDQDWNEPTGDISNNDDRTQEQSNKKIKTSQHPPPAKRTDSTTTTDSLFNVAKKQFTCTECGRRFPKVIAVRNHYRHTHCSCPTTDETSTNGKANATNNNNNADVEALIGPPIFRQPLKVAYEDDDLAVIVKPQGMPVQGSRFTLPKSDLLLPFTAPKTREGAFRKPRLVHRLDSQTGGLLIIAKVGEAERKLKACFEQRSCQKRYRAILFGKLTVESIATQECVAVDHDGCNGDETLRCTIDSPLSGKPSVTKLEVVSYTRCSDLRANGWITTVDLYPVTGRTHQLRKHTKLIGHPIYGDKRYAVYSNNPTTTPCTASMMNCTESQTIVDTHSKMCLWALEITFPHPLRCSQGEEGGMELIHAMIEEPVWYSDLRNYHDSQWSAGKSSS